MAAEQPSDSLKAVRARRRAIARGEAVPDRSAQRQPRKRRGQDIDGRPRPKRVLVFAALGLIAVAFGYGMGAVIELVFTDDSQPGQSQPLEPATKPSVPPPEVPGAQSATEPPRPWYETQPSPPVLVDLEPDQRAASPILPESLTEEPLVSGAEIDPASLLDRPRAYEEALPETVFRIVDEPDATDLAALPQPSVTAPPPILDHSGAGALPDDAATWQKRALAFTPKPDRPQIAIVIDDMGLDMRRTRGILDLPGPLTVAYLTYAENLRAQTETAWGKGHEVIAHVSMEPMSETVDPGPNVLMTNQSSETIKARLIAGLDGGVNFVGINNHMGSKFTQNPEVMAPVMEVLSERGLLFLDSRTSGATAGPAIARAYGVPYLVRNVFLDNDNEKQAVLANLKKTEKLARDQGFAIAIGHPRSATIQALAEWLPSLSESDLQLVPLSSIMVHRLKARAAAKASLATKPGEGSGDDPSKNPAKNRGNTNGLQ